MENTRLRIQKTGREAMAVLAQLRDGDAALLYAYAVCQDGGCTLPQAAQALEFSPEQAKKASQLLLVYGLAVNHTAPRPGRRRPIPPLSWHRSGAKTLLFPVCAIISRASWGGSSTAGSWRRC